MDTLKARFTLIYALIVLAVSAALVVALIWVLRPWPFPGYEPVSVLLTTIKLIGLGLIMLGVFATQIWDMLSPKDILTLTPSGLHDRRLTRGTILWHQIERLVFFRRGWQWMVRMEPKALTTPGRDMDLGPMPIYAFNRLCARWQKHPELVVGLGGMTVSTDDLIAYIQTHFKGQISLEQ